MMVLCGKESCNNYYKALCCVCNNSTPFTSLVININLFWRKKKEKHYLLSHCTGQTDCVSLINNFLSVEDLEYYTKPQGI